MFSAFVAFPATFVALIVKMDVLTAVGVPDIVPVFTSKPKPSGRLPTVIVQVIGTVPVAVSV